MTKRAKEYMNADFVYEDYRNLAEAQKIADVEDVTAISERLNKEHREIYSREVTREIPNSETISAINEVQQMKQNPSLGKSYTDIDKMMIDLTI